MKDSKLTLSPPDGVEGDPIDVCVSWNKKNKEWMSSRATGDEDGRPTISMFVDEKFNLNVKNKDSEYLITSNALHTRTQSSPPPQSSTFSTEVKDVKEPGERESSVAREKSSDAYVDPTDEDTDYEESLKDGPSTFSRPSKRKRSSKDNLNVTTKFSLLRSKAVPALREGLVCLKTTYPGMRRCDVEEQVYPPLSAVNSVQFGRILRDVFPNIQYSRRAPTTNSRRVRFYSLALNPDRYPAAKSVDPDMMAESEEPPPLQPKRDMSSMSSPPLIQTPMIPASQPFSSSPVHPLNLPKYLCSPSIEGMNASNEYGFNMLLPNYVSPSPQSSPLVTPLQSPFLPPLQPPIHPPFSSQVFCHPPLSAPLVSMPSIPSPFHSSLLPPIQVPPVVLPPQSQNLNGPQNPSLS